MTFTVRNIWEGTTTTEVTYYMLRNGELFRPETSLGILSPGETRNIEILADGATYQIFTSQEPNAPAASQPSAIANACGQDEGVEIATGFANLFPIGNGLPGESIACRANTGSFDPNDKRGFPLGVGSENDIEPGTRIDYNIRFQNTGTDTAFTVIIRDTLSEDLDLSTLRLGGSSHEYGATLDSNRVLSFRFDNILLPDSTTNLLESQGIVSFSIDHDQSLNRGDLILNKAAIYFDFNEPIITNLSQHRLAPEALVNPTALVASISEAVNASCGIDNGSIAINLAGGASPFTYAWSHDAELNGPVATGLSGGSYSVTITTANGIRVTLEQELTEGLAITASANPEVVAASCNEDNGSIRVNLDGGSGPLTYSWSHQTDLNSPFASGLAPGEYSITATDAAGCDYSTTQVVGEVPALSLDLSVLNNVACRGEASGSLNLRVTGGTPPFNYEWEGGEPNPGQSPAGTYTVTVTDARSCVASISGTITEPDEIVVGTTVTPSSCEGTSSGTIQVTTTGGVAPYSYRWLELPLETGPEVDGLVAGEYTVVVTDANGCVSTQTSVVTETGNNIVIELTGRNEVSCRGVADGSITVSATDGTNALSYLWSNGQSGPTATGLAGGEDYIVIVSNTDGCSSQLRVNLPAGPEANLSQFPKDTFICAGDSYEIDLSEYPNRSVTTVAGFSSDAAVLQLAEQGVYNITVNTSEGCELSRSLALGVTDSSFTAVAELQTDAVITLPYPAIDASIPEPDRVSWRFNEEAVTLTGRDDRTYFFEFSEPGDYELGLVAYLRGCSDSTFTTITIHADSSTITSLPVAAAAEINLRIGPNPSNGNFTLFADFPVASKATVLLYSFDGRLKLQRQLPRVTAVRERFDLDFPAGAYFLYLVAPEGKWMVPVIIR